MSLSIIIVSWNTRNLLAHCLKSIIYHPSSIVYVVDNASSDGSVAMVRDRFPQVRLIESHKNLGFAGGNNLGIHTSKGDYVFLLNPDSVVKAGAIEQLTWFMTVHPECGVAGAKLLNVDGSLQISCAPFPTLFREFWRLFHLDKLYPLSQYPLSKWGTDTPQTVDSVQGAAILLRREALAQVGLLDEDYFMYSEEVDLCQRIKQAGWEIYWVPEAEVLHYGGKSTEQVACEMFLELYRSKVLYFRKRHGVLQAMVYKLIVFLASLPRVMLAPFPGKRDLAGKYSQLMLALPGM